MNLIEFFIRNRVEVLQLTFEHLLLVLDSPMTIPPVPSDFTMPPSFFQKTETWWLHTKVNSLVDASFASLSQGTKGSLPF